MDTERTIKTIHINVENCSPCFTLQVRYKTMRPVLNGKKSVIVRAEPKGLLNKRTELISKCGHKNKLTLKSLK